MAKNFDPRYNPAFQPGFEAAPAAPPKRSGLEPIAVVEPVETRGNPWLLALWIVTAVFVVGGVSAQYIAQLALQSGYATTAIDYYVVPATVQALSPWFTLAGLFAGVSALVLSAVRWRSDPQ